MWFKKKKKRELIDVVRWLSKNRVKYDFARFRDKVIVTAIIRDDAYDIMKEGDSLYLESLDRECREMTSKEIINVLERELRW